MQGRSKLLTGMIAIIVMSIFVSGCAVNFYKQSPRSKRKIQELQSQISSLQKQQDEERKKFEDAKSLLESRLRDEIKNEDISLTVDERGLVIVLSDEVLFDSGKADVKIDAYPILDDVIYVVKKKVPNKDLGISGHTDNVPIQRSGWKTNWELSTARATNVLHYLESKGIEPQKLSATGYGEYRPVASNDTARGRAKNRRVEIVILPEFGEERQIELKEELKEVVK